MTWKSQLDMRRPYWDGYRELVTLLAEDQFPDAGQLNRLLPEGTANRRGLKISFAHSASVSAQPYEKHIFETGQVSTRSENWHDLFNALVWCRLPRSKAAMNALHYQNLHLEREGRRGKLRDALTLLDESGVIVLSRHDRLLQSLHARHWQTAFVGQREDWSQGTRLVVCGHALLEKFLDPYKSITAHALLLRPGDLDLPHEGIPGQDLDEALSGALLSGRLLTSPADLSPLPLMGIPGWHEQQDEAFYDDESVFRPPRPDRTKRPKPGRSGPA